MQHNYLQGIISKYRISRTDLDNIHNMPGFGKIYLVGSKETFELDYILQVIPP